MGVVFLTGWSVACVLVVDHLRVSRIVSRVLWNRCGGVGVLLGYYGVYWGYVVYTGRGCSGVGEADVLGFLLNDAFCGCMG